MSYSDPKNKENNANHASLQALNLSNTTTSIPSLKQQNGHSKSSSHKSPNIRRHFSEPAINLEKLFLNGNDFDDNNTENDADKKAADCFNEANFSKDPIKFAQELQTMIKTIKMKKKLPSYSIVMGLLNILDFWIKTHGICAINELNEAMNKYDALQMDHNKERMILEQHIEEYKNEYAQYQTRRDAMNQKHTELTLKIKDLSSQLTNAAFLQERLVVLREELDTKSNENDKNMKKCNEQQMKINELKNEIDSFLKVIDAQKQKLSKMNAIETELKLKQNEIEKMKEKCVKMEGNLKKMSDEKNELLKEKKMGEYKLSNYGKLQFNLCQYKANEKEYEQRIKKLEIERDILLKKEMECDDSMIDEGVVTVDGKETEFIGFRDKVRSYNESEGIKEENETSNGYDAMYKSIMFIGVSCLCYIVYLKYSKGRVFGFRKLNKKIQKKCAEVFLLIFLRTMSHKFKTWLTSIRRSHSSPIHTTSSSSTSNNNNNNKNDRPFDNIGFDVIQYILSFLHPHSLHRIRHIGKEWNNLCDLEQKILSLNTNTPCEHLKYWMLKLRNIKHVNLSHNKHINNQFLIWLKKEYFPLKIKQKQRGLSIHHCDDSHSHSHTDLDNVNDIKLHIHIDISFCFGIDCVEEPQLYGRGGVNGHNSYLMKLMNAYIPFGCTFNIFGNFRIINPSQTLEPRHVVLLQLEALKYDEVQHCFKFASPANRQFTGPLPRFERMIKIGYPALIYWDKCRILDGEQELAVNEEVIDGIEFVTKKHFIVHIENNHCRKKFKWTLSKQTLKPFEQCWMTDSVSSVLSR